MKKFTLIASSLFLSAALAAQVYHSIPAEKRNFRSLAPPIAAGGEIPGAQQQFVIGSHKSLLSDPVPMFTTYDLMTNSSAQNRVYAYPDGTVGVVETMSHENTSTFADRGTGYNYFNGSTWGAQPASRLESIRTGWPSYAPWNNGGEIVVSHHFATFPLIKMTRPVKGTGNWTQAEIPNPTGAAGMDWPRMVTNGPGNLYVHVIALTTPTGNGGSTYQGLDGALLYNRSLDGGSTWDGWQLLPGMTSAEYLGFSADTYAFAEPRGDTLCFVVADGWYDGFIMKSEDNGTTWEKTKFWSCPHNLWAGGDSVEMFYCPDGSDAVALDKYGKAHVLFGLQRSSGDETGGKYWYPFTDGIVYWNEDMPELPQGLDPDTLFDDGNLVGWVQDTMVWYAASTELAYYYLSMSSMPSMVIDDNTGTIYPVWSGLTNFRDASNFMLRHIYTRPCYNLGNTWGESFIDLTSDFVYSFSECVYPFVAANIVNDKYSLTFMSDAEAGVFLNGSSGAQGQTSISTNDIIYLNPDLVVGIPGPRSGQPESLVNGPFPNPASGRCYIDIVQPRNGEVRLEVFSVTGTTVVSLNEGTLPAGPNRVYFDTGSLSSGIWFCRVISGNHEVVRKLMVE